MATTKITSPDLFNLGSLNTALKLPSGTTAERPTSPSTGEWRYNTTTNLVEFWDGGAWRDLQSEDIPPINSENFNVVLYTGNGSTQSITGVGFKPDWVWIKERSATESHRVFDTTRGATKRIFPNSTSAESTASDSLTSFDADGFSLGSSAGINENSQTYVAWCWKANGGTTSSNTDGTITSTVQVNNKAGFSIVKWTGTGSAATIGHGLSSAPKLIIQKSLSATSDWIVYHGGISSPNSNFLTLNSTGAVNNISNYFGSGGVTSSVFGVIGSPYSINANGVTQIAYCFADTTDFSKFGTYTGTGAAGNEQNTGFEPAFVLIKRTDSAGAWSLYDNKRSPSNPRDKKLVPNSDAAENNAGTTYQLNFLTNGFNFLGGGVDLNANGATFIYIAFAANPSTAPVLADSFANKLYTGNGTSQSITGLGFSPNFSWIKVRNNTYVHGLYDTLRGPLQRLRSNGTQANENVPNSLTSFDSDGFTLGSDIGQNQTGMNYVAWNWKANPIPTINTDGTIQSLVSANQASGFSIVKLTGTGSAATIGHGLSAVPELIIVKHLNGANDWWVYNKDLNGGTNPASYFLKLNTSDAEILNGSGSVFQGTSPTSTVFYGGTAITDTGREMIAYCFHSVSGYSKISSYTGNGSTQSITGLGFQPDFIFIKGITSADNWFIFDSARGDSVTVNANLSAAEYADTGVTSFDSDGFTLGSGAGENRNGDTYIYMAIKQNPTPYPLAGNMSFLVIAGGASGAISHGGGGGAGGLRTSYGSTSGGGSSAESDITLAAGTYTITVGAGANGVTPAGSNLAGNNGADSSIAATGLTTITSIGGGGGSAYNGQTTPGNGGSGGGGGNQSQAGGLGTAGQGYNGGTGSSSSINYPTGGGGGAGAVGGNGSGTSAGNGGAGLETSITGSSVAYAGGAGGSSFRGGTAGTGGIGGGANGTNSDGTGNAGTVNTGGGGSGATAATSGAGGSGVIILRLLTSEYSSSTTGSPTVTTDGDYTVLTYTGSGTYVHS